MTIIDQSIKQNMLSTDYYYY